MIQDATRGGAGPQGATRRRLSTAGAALATSTGGAALAACAAPGSAPAAGTAKTAVTPIRVWFHWGGTEGELSRAFVEQYNDGQGHQDKNRVEVETVPGAEMLQKMTAVAAGGEQPEVWSTGSSVKVMSQGGLITSLPKEEETFVKSTYAPGAVDAATLAGKVWGYPTEWQAPAYFYRKSHYREAGLAAPPTSTDELTDYAQKLTRRLGDTYERFGLGLNYRHPYLFNHLPGLIARFGGQMYTFQGDRPTRVDVASPAAMEAVGWWVNLVKNGVTNVDQMDYTQALANGFMSGAEHGVFFPILNLRNKGLQVVYDDLGAVPLVPKRGQKPVAFAAGWGIYPTRAARQPDERWKFMRWCVARPDMPLIKFVVEQIGSLPSVKDYPARIAGWSDDMIRGFAVETPKIAQAHPGLRVLGEADLQKTTMDALPDILTGKVALQTGLQQLSTQLNELLSRNNQA